MKSFPTCASVQFDICISEDTQGWEAFLIVFCVLCSEHHHQRAGSRRVGYKWSRRLLFQNSPVIVIVRIMSLQHRNCTWEYKLGIKFIRDEGEGASYSCNIGQEIARGKAFKNHTQTPVAGKTYTNLGEGNVFYINIKFENKESMSRNSPHKLHQTGLLRTYVRITGKIQ